MPERILVVLVVLVCSFHLEAQLKPFIGLTTLPADLTPTCKEPVFNGSFYNSGYQAGDTVADFKLYDINGDSLLLSNELSAGKPVILIAGSLTCPVFRNKVSTINQVASVYANKAKVFVIYTLEAHPTDTSVYFGYVNVTSQNTTAGILFPNTLTYGDRKLMADTMKNWVTLNVPVFLDGPCNNWWKHYGPAPNNFYLISPAGVVLNKQGWFDKYPDDVFCILDSLLSVSSGLCAGPSTQQGTFKLNIINTVSFGQPASYLYDYIDIINTTTVNTTFKIKKLQNTLPSSWQTAICADICYGTGDDSATVIIPPLDTIHFSLDFITGSQPDSGSVKMGFKNMYKSNNAFTVWLSGNTLQTITDNAYGEPDARHFSVFPNPAANEVNITSFKQEFLIEVFDELGRQVYQATNQQHINLDGWSAGIYHLVLRSDSGVERVKLVITGSQR